MKVFLSWSGARSKAAAQILRQWLPDVIQSIEPWMSAEDIDAGTRWSAETANKLAESHCGIICLTKDNQTAPWILFEAGALSKTKENTYVIPYLIDLEPSDILSGPLTQFQPKRANKSETWELIHTLNAAMDSRLTDEQLKRGFERCWNELETKLNDLPEPTGHQEERSQKDMLVEVLDVVRRISRTIDDNISPLASKEALEMYYQGYGDAKSISSREALEAYLQEPYRKINTEFLAKSSIRLKIISTLRIRGTVKAIDLIEMFDSRLKNDVIRELERLRYAEFINYQSPLTDLSLISLDNSAVFTDSFSP